MSTKSIHPYAVALYYTQAELQELGLEMPVTAQTARRLVSNALCGSGREPWSGMEVDLFSYEDAVLLLARPSQESAHCFLFRDFEELLAAVRCLPETAPSTLLWADGNFFLFLGVCSMQGIGALYEFGQPVCCTPEQSAHLAEHGNILIGSRAIFTLGRYFAR